ncbi:MULTISPECIES: hypothetical protein [Halolamina]|uniref:Uncharacterized protein n=1 Tax=Halolamina pelagica TaxID=699431 RepID=A0A1I5VLG9_9EURY|nr:MULTISPECIES: hypothetical protein [Halolamina]NHX37630.1 hypothetical protein [Halolamina sp. R1-12]SFQ07846.1 hypothetical protein SAMN05216277_11845 [Halolamina pelagica]
MAELITVATALLLSIAIGLWLFARFSSGGDVAVASFGLIRNASTLLIGVFLLMTGAWPLVILGGLIIVVAVFLGSTHAKNLDQNTSLRKKIAG